MNDLYHTIAAPSEGLYKEKGSKFMAFAYPIRSVDEAKSHIDDLRKRFFDARHHCYAYALGAERGVYRANDDGEPSGTGGRPIYGQLLSKDVSDVLVVVVRYFGGVLLGASGLANAYKIAARDALDNAVVVDRTVDVALSLHFQYEQMNDVMRMLKDYNISPRSQHYDTDCCIDIEVRQGLVEQLRASVGKLRSVHIVHRESV